MEFRTGFGAWPETWAEFVHGVGHLSRASAAQKLRMADAFAASRDGKNWAKWVRDQQTLAGL